QQLALAWRGRPVGARPASEAQLQPRAQLVLEEALFGDVVLREPEKLVGRLILQNRGLLDQHAPHPSRQILLALSCVCRHMECLRAMSLWVVLAIASSAR